MGPKGPLGDALDTPWTLWGPCWELRGAPGTLCGALGELFGSSGGVFGSSWGLLWEHVGTIFETFFLPRLDLLSFIFFALSVVSVILFLFICSLSFNQFPLILFSSL